LVLLFQDFDGATLDAFNTDIIDGVDVDDSK